MVQKYKPKFGNLDSQPGRGRARCLELPHSKLMSSGDTLSTEPVHERAAMELTEAVTSSALSGVLALRNAPPANSAGMGMAPGALAAARKG